MRRNYIDYRVVGSIRGGSGSEPIYKMKQEKGTTKPFIQ